MKALYRALRLLVSCIVSAIPVYLCLFRMLDNANPDVAARTFLLSTLVVGVIVTLIWEMHLKIRDLSKRVDKIEINRENYHG